MYACVPLVCCALRGQKRLSDPLGLELQMAVGGPVGAENGTRVAARVTSPLSYLFSPLKLQLFICHPVNTDAGTFIMY